MTLNRQTERTRIRRLPIALLAAAALAIAAAPPAAAATTPVWPDDGMHVLQNVLGPDDYDTDGYVFQVVYPEGGRVDCVAASPTDLPTTKWSFVDQSGVEIAPVTPIGGGGAPYLMLDVIVKSPKVTSAKVGSLQTSCMHSDGSASALLRSIPLTVTNDPKPLYNASFQWTTFNMVAGQRTSVAAMGFAPGEAVNVSLVEPTDWPPVQESGTTVIADGAGAVRAELAVPTTWGPEESLVLIAAGATSHSALMAWHDYDALDQMGDFSATTVPLATAPSKQGIRAQLTGYPAGSTVLVAVHSAAAPLVLGTVTVDASGAGAKTFALPRVLTASDVVFAGVKSGGYNLLSAVPSIFADVSSTQGSPRFSAFANEISWMANRGISTGYEAANATREYRAFGTVTRDAMAAFLYRAAGSPTFTAPAVSPFVDVPKTHPFYKEITWLADQKISEGWAVAGKKEFRPALNITRDAMAAFLYRYADKPAFTPPSTSQFADVPTSNGFYKEIAWMASTGITTGYDLPGGKKEFRPFNPITRDAMAAFLFRFDALP